jgi:hemerythrin-like domain-containing protein
MKYASEDLMAEHNGILLGLQILVEQVRLIDIQQQVDLTDLRDMVHFFQLFADRCHHGKEEGFYFPSMQKVGDSDEADLISQLLEEHAAGRHLVTQMKQAVEGPFLAQTYSNAAAAYEQLLRAHIEKENSLLFKAGDCTISPDEQSQMLDTFITFEDEVMGPGTHAKLHQMLDRLEEKYLV